MIFFKFIFAIQTIDKYITNLEIDFNYTIFKIFLKIFINMFLDMFRLVYYEFRNIFSENYTIFEKHPTIIFFKYI